MGKRNQLYGKWKRLLPNPDDEKEIYLVLEKDEPMDLKYIRQFENMFQGKDVIITIGELIRHKHEDTTEESPEETEEIPPEPKTKKKKTEEEDEKSPESPFWDVQQ